MEKAQSCSCCTTCYSLMFFIFSIRNHRNFATPICIHTHTIYKNILQMVLHNQKDDHQLLYKTLLGKRVKNIKNNVEYIRFDELISRKTFRCDDVTFYLSLSSGISSKTDEPLIKLLQTFFSFFDSLLALAPSLKK